MSQSERRTIRVALLDLYEGMENQGMRCLREILQKFSDAHDVSIDSSEFDVRMKGQLPDLSYDIYISSGGPGSPLDSQGMKWENDYFDWLSQLMDWNSNSTNCNKKFVFFICHSFQLACRYFEAGNICKRQSTSFGVFPIHLNEFGSNESIFKYLPDPFYAVDSRDFQLIAPNYQKLSDLGATIIAIEKERPHVSHFERAVMAIRFNPYMVGTQFHPEADAIGMSKHLQTPERKKIVIENHGEAKWQSMIEHLNDPEKIMFTYAHIIPQFLQSAISNNIN